MSEKEKQDSTDLATMLRNLSKEERLQVQGVIAGMILARKVSENQQIVMERTGA